MSWQSPVHGGTGDPNAQGGNVNGPQSVGTEYTLQGVMRFLQTEWHRHERDRNQWEIERAEMRARIAKLEGENNAARRLQQSYLLRMKMLEQVIKNERAKSQAISGDQKDKTADDEANKKQTESPEAGAPKRPEIPRMNSILDASPPPLRSEAARQKSRAYLSECLKEITYLLIPPNHPPPANHLTIDPITGQALDPLALSQKINQQQQPQQNHIQQQQQQQSSLFQPPPPPPPQQQQQQQQQSIFQTHNVQNQHKQLQNNLFQEPPSLGGPIHTATPITPAPGSLPFSNSHDNIRQQGLQPPRKDDGGQHARGIGIPPFSDDYPPAEKISHRFNSMGEPLTDESAIAEATRAAQESSAVLGSITGSSNVDSEGWNFDEVTHLPGTENGATSHDEALKISNVPPSPTGGRRDSSGRRKSMSRRRSSQDGPLPSPKPDIANFKVRFALRGHLDVVRAICFTGGGTSMEPEICTAGDDGVLKRWYVSAAYMGGSSGGDVDLHSHFTHRGHAGTVTCLASSASASVISAIGQSDHWLFSGGVDSTVKVWKNGRVDAKATLVGHTDAVWAVCVLPNPTAEEKIFLASGSADGTVKVWSVTAPAFAKSPGLRRDSSGSYMSSSGTIMKDFTYSLLTTITRESDASPTCITPLSMNGENFIVSYTDAAIVIFHAKTGEELASMSSLESYNGTIETGVNTVVATTLGLGDLDSSERSVEEEAVGGGATGDAKLGLAGVVISGTEDRYIRFYDANSGQCTYNMLAHPASISCLALSPDTRDLVSAGHDASLRFWSMEKRACTQEITSHRLMRGEGVCVVVWSSDGRWVVSGGGDGVVKVYSR